MKLLIATPYLSVVGGTEIETLTTAQELAHSGRFKKIEIFCPHKIELEKFKDLTINQNIKFITYPGFFKNKNTQRFNLFIKRFFNLKTPFLEGLYWFFKRKNSFDYLYILTSTNQNYYFPLLYNYKPKNCLIKYSLVYEEAFPKWKKNYLRSVKWNIVTNEHHQAFLKNILKSNNVVIQDIVIANEQSLLKCQSRRQFTFGLLCRISREKKIEDAILLIKELNISGQDASLIIQGEGDDTYLDELMDLIKKYKLEEAITVIKKNIPPAKTHLFYRKISFFLITSKFETGPLTGLEAMAAGVPVLSYNVGAMKDRIGKHTYLIVNDFEDMLGMAKNLIHLNEIEYKNLSDSLRQTYISHCSNAPKVKNLENLIFKFN